MSKTVCHGPEAAIGRLEAIDLRWQLRTWAISLLVSIGRVRKPNASIAVNDNVVDRVERPSVKVGNHQLGVIRLHSRDLVQAAGCSLATLGAEEYASLVVDASIGHEDPIATYFLAGRCSRGVPECDFRYLNDRCSRTIKQAIAGDEEFIGIGYEYTCFMSKRDIFLDQALYRRSRSKQ